MALEGLQAGENRQIRKFAQIIRTGDFQSKNKHASKRISNSQGRGGNGKTAVVGLLERDGAVKTFVIDNTEANTLHPIMLANVKPSATVVTDAYRSYNGLSTVYNHITVKHTENNYITVGEDHTNNVEGFWSLLKRGVIGIYHNVSPKHLHRYCNEFGFRYNSRKVADATCLKMLLRELIISV
jgi:transposase-like protein